MRKVICPSCRTRLKLPGEMLGGEVRCGRCGILFYANYDGSAQFPTQGAESKQQPISRRRFAIEEDVDDEYVPKRSQSREESDQPQRRNHGSEESDQPRKEEQIRTKYCHECGEVIRKAAVICPKCGVRQASKRQYRYDYDDEPNHDYYSADDPARRKIAAGVLGILLGGLGIHKFIIGYTGTGMLMLLVSLFSGVIGFFVGCVTCGVGWALISGSFVMGIIGFIEGIMYLCTDDRTFRNKHRRLNRPWF